LQGIVEQITLGQLNGVIIAVESMPRSAR